MGQMADQAVSDGLTRPDSSLLHPDADLRRADLSRTDLRRADLRRAHLGEADLHRADLTSANLTSADLRVAHFHRTTLHGAHLARAAPDGAHFHHADPAGTILIDAGLHNADLHGADLTRADLTDAGLTDTNPGLAVGLEVRLLAGAYWNRGTTRPEPLRDRIREGSEEIRTGNYRVRSDEDPDRETPSA